MANDWAEKGANGERILWTTQQREVWFEGVRGSGMGVDDWKCLVLARGWCGKDRGGWFLAREVAEPMNKCSALAAEMKGCEAVVGVLHAMFESEVF